ncbi:MAG: DUF3147 family protein [Candidatus Cloacimonetes bacterium]|nr:DUF3147 family protein [Candidatus Cloacimonadota bacterium]
MNIWYYVIKVLISSLLIVLVSEIGKKGSALAGLLASIPLVSILAILWIYLETKDIESIRKLSAEIFWMVLPSLSFFIVFPYLLSRKTPFGWAMLLSITIMVILYGSLIFILKRNWS